MAILNFLLLLILCVVAEYMSDVIQTDALSMDVGSELIFC